MGVGPTIDFCLHESKFGKNIQGMCSFAPKYLKCMQGGENSIIIIYPAVSLDFHVSPSNHEVHKKIRHNLICASAAQSSTEMFRILFFVI